MKDINKSNLNSSSYVSYDLVTILFKNIVSNYNYIKILENKIEKLKNDNNALNEKIKKINSFHSYNLGKQIVIAQKKWGIFLGIYIGAWNHYRSKKNNSSNS